MTNAVSNNINSISNIAPAPSISEQVASSSALENFGMAQIASDEFSSSISNTSQAISDVESQINSANDENKKQELKNRKEELISRKKELQNKKTALQSKMAQLKAEIDSHRSVVEASKSELNKLNANKSSLEKTIQNENKDLAVKNSNLSSVSDKISSTKAELDDEIATLNKAVAEATKQSEEELNAQRAAVSAATSNALELVESGELKAEEMPSYIAGKISDYTSVGNTNAGSVIVDSQNTKIKALCSQISSYVNQQGHIQLSIKASSSKLQLVSPLLESLDSKIKGKNTEYKASENTLNSKQSELDSASAEFVNQDLELTNIDSEIATINTQIVESEADVTKPGQMTKEAPKVQYPQFFMAAQGSSVEINLDEEIGKIDAKSRQILEEQVKNTEVDGLRSKMAEADKLIITLRNHLADNAQKIIEERLEATKRR